MKPTKRSDAKNKRRSERSEKPLVCAATAAKPSQKAKPAAATA